MHGETLYIGTVEGDVRALDISSGETIWRFELEGRPEISAVYGTPVVDADTLYFGGYDGHLYSLSLDGELVWDEIVGDHDLDSDPDPIVGGTAVAEGMLLVGSSDGYLYSFDTEDGAQNWRFPTGNKVWSTPALVDGVAYFGSLDQHVYAVATDDGEELWRFPTKGGVAATPVVAQGRVYVGAFDSVFYALDAQTGSEVWRFDGASGWYWGEAVATEDTIYAPSLDGSLYALDIVSGRLRWSYATGGRITGSPVIVGDRIAIPSSDGRVSLVKIDDGGDEQICNVGSKIRASLVAHDGIIYVSADDHSIRALSIKRTGNPDEEWVHFSNEGDPVPLDWTRSC